MKATVIHHSADYDGIFCREIARKFLPESEFIGWDFGQPKIKWPSEGQVYILDLSPECIEILPDINEAGRRLCWIDHHKSSIAKWPDVLPGYRIDGVAACRLTWQWFRMLSEKKEGETWPLPTKQEYEARGIPEPLAVTLGGEYDVWQHGNSKGDDITFQFGLDSVESLHWEWLLNYDESYSKELITRGRAAQQCYKKRDADVVRTRSFDLAFEGLNFIALNTARCNSQTFDAAIKPEHDGCLAFYWNRKMFVVSLYGVPHKPEVDLSVIAVKHGGGGHRQACGFQAKTLPWLA